MHRFGIWLIFVCLVLSMAGCGGGGSSQSTGPTLIAVPNVVGLSQAAATSAITAAGLTLGAVTKQSSNTVASGNVISESPAAGTSVASSSTISLVVSTGSAYAVSVTVSGLAAGQSVTVLDNGTDSLTFQSNSTMQFANQLALNATYSVTVSAQPALETCNVAGGSGQVTAPVAVSVSCSLAPPSTIYPAFTPPYPMDLSGQTPAVIVASPRFVPVFFSDTPDQPDTLTYLQALATSNEWSVLGEYGVGPATVGSPVYLSTAAPTTTTTVGISAFVVANAASWGTLDGSEIFILYYPTSTTITDLAQGASYHSVATVTSQKVPYAVIPNFTPASDDYVQFHELAEAATDPIPHEGYMVPNHDFTAWSFDETELADLCIQFSQYYDPSFSQLMEGIWSNAAVSKGQYPCTTVGSSNLGYDFGAYPVLPNTYIGSAGPGDTNASVGIAPGASVTIPINIFSYGPMNLPIQVSVQQFNTNPAKTNALTFSLDQNYGLNGSVLHLTITAPQTPLSSTTNFASFLVFAGIAANNNGTEAKSVFPGLVTNPGASCSTLQIGAPGSAETILYGFTGGSDGYAPHGGLVQASDGDFYGTTAGTSFNSALGGNQYGTVFKITPEGALTLLHSFSSSDGLSPDASLVLGSDGNFYGTTSAGGSNNDGTVFMITPGSTFTSLYSFSGNDGLEPYSRLVQGSDGNFYGTTFEGMGTLGKTGSVFKITPAGTLTQLHSFIGTDGLAPEAGLVQGSDGNFYGTTSVGGSANDGTVFRMTPAGALTTLYSFSGTDGANPDAGLVQGSNGNFYGTTGGGGANNDGTVFMVSPSGTLTTLYSFSGSDGMGPTGDLILARDGNFYGTTSEGGTYGKGSVFKITPSGTLTTLNSFGYSSIDGAFPYAGVVQGSDGNFYGTTFLGGGCGAGSVFKIAVGSGG